MEEQEIDYTGAREDLLEMVREEFTGNNEVNFLITPENYQRIEIKDLDTGEVWQTIQATQATQVVGDSNNFDNISIAMIQMLFSLIQEAEENYAKLN